MSFSVALQANVLEELIPPKWINTQVIEKGNQFKKKKSVEALLQDPQHVENANIRQLSKGGQSFFNKFNTLPLTSAILEKEKSFGCLTL